jgi:hypothetical protein
MSSEIGPLKKLRTIQHIRRRVRCVLLVTFFGSMLPDGF